MSLFVAQPASNAPTLRAILAFIVHAGQTDAHEPSTYAFMTHEIEHTPEGIVLGPGRLLSERDQQDLIGVLLNTHAYDNEFLPVDVLSRSSARLSWYVPGQRRRMWFRDGSRTESYEVPWPNLIFCASRDHLRLVAVTGRDRPTVDQPLFHAPLMNVHATTALCAGTAALPEGTGLADRPGYEHACFETAFSHVNHAQTLRLNKRGPVSSEAHVQFWRALARQGAPQFPEDALVPLGQTLSQWLTER